MMMFRTGHSATISGNIKRSRPLSFPKSPSALELAAVFMV